MKIALLTMFNGLSSSYSLVNIVREQLLMFLNHDIHVKMLVSEHCPKEERTGVFTDSRIEWVSITNSENHIRFQWEDLKDQAAFERHTDTIASDFVAALKDVDVCFLHDILYQQLHLIHNVAIRKAQSQLPNLRFLAFTHSCPVVHKDADYPESCMFTPMPHTLYCYPTKSGLPALAAQYGITEDLCRHVSNSVDVMQGMTEETLDIHRMFPLTKSDILIVYPARMSMAKGFHLLAQFAGAVHKVSGKSVSVIYCDFPASDICPHIYKAIIRDVGEKAGLPPENIFLTSENGYAQGVQRETVYDLFSLSNLFICPSFSESFGLTVVEAAARGNFIIVNDAVYALHELGTDLGAYPMRWPARNFGKVEFERYEPSEQEYMETHAKIVAEQLENNPVLYAKTRSRTRYSTDWIYEHQVKPLLFHTEASH